MKGPITGNSITDRVMYTGMSVAPEAVKHAAHGVAGAVAAQERPSADTRRGKVG